MPLYTLSLAPQIWNTETQLHISHTCFMCPEWQSPIHLFLNLLLIFPPPANKLSKNNLDYSIQDVHFCFQELPKNK